MIVFLALGMLGLLLLVVGLVAGEVLDVIDVGLEWISPLVVGAFLSAFGFSGAIATASGGSTAVGVGAGAVGGLLFGAGAAWLTRFLSRDDPDPGISSEWLVGAVATVVNAIPADGYGTVTVTVSGHMQRLNALSDEPVDSGSPVRIVEVLSPTSVQVMALGPPIP